MPRDMQKWNDWQRNRRNQIKAFLIEFKLEHGCVDCGYRENADALEFDHIGSDKRNNVAALVPHGMKTVLAELAKCEVRCANCHAIITQKRRRGEV